jgi:hypothetical protein
MKTRAFSLLLAALAAVPSLSCSSGGNSLTGSVSQVYDLSFSSIVIELEDQSVSIKYVGPSGDPAVLVVDIANLASVANVSINLTQLDNGQPRGVLQNVGEVTTDLPIMIGTVVFDQAPTVGAQLSGNFAATLSNPSGYTLDGNFSGIVNAP